MRPLTAPGRASRPSRPLQLHGGYAYLGAYDTEKIVRDLCVHQILEGTNENMRVIVARGLTEAFR
ncbi:acyl-CoA dehydrogenase family protein [Streptomyces sp. MMCC 100]|uniref:acyl-CoA dehydrogenase family protein n=1 Tax=Streptomyces sp. MMCC 100 TaxID=3163555 RepID=UPI00359AE4FE